MAAPTDPKSVLRSYLQESRDALLWKLEGLTEEQARRPRTSTGTNLLGIVKHCLNVEAGYFGPTFGRRWPIADRLVPMTAYDEDPQADWYATAEEPMADLVELYRRVWELADTTIDELPLDAPGRVSWWHPDRQEVTLQRIMVHLASEIARHAGQADILREEIDGAVGRLVDRSNVPGLDWPAYVAKLDALADRFGR